MFGCSVAPRPDGRRCLSSGCGADAVLDEGAGQAAGDRVGGLPAGAVGGDDHLGGELLERIDGVPDDRFEQRAGQMEAADDGVQLVDAGQSLGVTADVDDARVPAAGEHDQPAPGDVGDQRLVVEDQRVRLPACAAPGLVDREALLEAGDPVDLPGDQHRPVVQERRLPLLDDAEACVFQRAAAGGGQLERLAGNGQAPPGPELGVDQHRQVRPAELADQAGQPGGVVEVAMAADDRLDAGRILAQAAQVAGAPVGGHPGVEQQPAHPAALADLHQRGEPVLGQRHVSRLAPQYRRGLQQRCQPGHPGQREPLRRPLVRQQHVHDVVADRQHRQLIDRLERKHLALPLQAGRQRFGRRDSGTVTGLTHGGSSLTV